MKYVGDLIRAAIVKGYKPIVNRGMVAMCKCTSCGAIKMVKFSPPGNARKRVHACICGYRKGFEKGGAI